MYVVRNTQLMNMATKTTTISVPQQLLFKGRDLLHIFETMVDAFEVLFVVEDLKPVARIELHESQYAAVRDFCAANGLSLELSFFKILKPDKNAPGFDPSNHVAEMVPTGHQAPGTFFAYVSKSPDEAQHARFYEHIRNDERLGELLGYPACCIKFYKDNYNKAAELHDDYCFSALPTRKRIRCFIRTTCSAFLMLLWSAIFHARLNVLTRCFRRSGGWKQYGATIQRSLIMSRMCSAGRLSRTMARAFTP